MRAREWTNRIIEMKDDGMADPDWLIESLLNWMSEADVREFYRMVIEHELFDPLDDDE